MTIIHHIDGHTLFQAETDDMAECLRLANRQNVDIQGADLSNLDLRGADLREVNLSETYLQSTNFQGANISESTFKGANLFETNLSFANLCYANFQRASLFRTNLYYGTLHFTDFQAAHLFRTNLCRASLMKADFTNAKMIDVDLQEASLRGAIGFDPHVAASLRILPEGDVIGWKKCRDGVLVKLQIPAKARRSNGTSRKCRAEYVNVLEVIHGCTGVSLWDRDVAYEKGKTVTCDRWNEDPWVTCGGGIQFFITREEAEAFEL